MDWVKVEDEIPKQYEKVLVFDKNEGICVGYRHTKNWSHHPLGDFATGAPLFYVTHCMPLPNPPQNNAINEE